MAIILLSLENEDARLFRAATGKVRVERIDGEPFLVAGAELQDIHLVPGVQGSVGSGHVGQALDALKLNGLISVTRADGALRIGRGPGREVLTRGFDGACVSPPEAGSAAATRPHEVSALLDAHVAD